MQRETPNSALRSASIHLCVKAINRNMNSTAQEHDQAWSYAQCNLFHLEPYKFHTPRNYPRNSERITFNTPSCKVENRRGEFGRLAFVGIGWFVVCSTLHRQGP
eukprot:2891773-Amphidinium_carterae.1